MLNRINLLHDFLQKAIFHLKLLFKYFKVKIFGHIEKKVAAKINSKNVHLVQVVQKEQLSLKNI